MHSSDLDTIRAINEGNKDVFRQVFDSCYEGLCQYAFTLLKDMDEAEDIVQNMFLKVWERREDLDIKHNIRSYLFRAVYHQSINQLEHRNVKMKYQEFGQRELSESQQPEIFPEELEESIKSAINELPPQCRIIFMMSRFEELRYSEIADKLGISVNTVENQVSKALKILRSRLKDILV